MRIRTSLGGALYWGLAGLLLAGGMLEPAASAAPLLESQFRRGRPASKARAQPAKKILDSAQRAVGRRRPGPGPRFIERLMGMSPQQRRRFLQHNKRFQQLSPRQRQQVFRRLQRLSRLPPEQRQLALERYRLFHRLPAEKQSQARAVYRQWRELPSERRAELLDEFENLREASPAARQERLDSEQFADSYSEKERAVLKELTDLFAPSVDP